MHIITQYYNPPNKKRQAEIDYCLQQNLNNPAISVVHNLMEKGSHLPASLQHTKLVTTTHSRITYAMCFDYIRTSIIDKEVVAICNNDIFLNTKNNNPWHTVKEDFFEASTSTKVLNLSRHEYSLSGKIQTTDNYSSYSSDCWAIQTPLLDIPDTQFHIGVLFADWAIAGRFRDAGYHVYNWADKYITYHLDKVLDRRSRHPNRKKHTISNSPESEKSRLFICPYLNYNMFLASNINPQKAKCVKKCKNKHIGREIKA